MSSSATTPLSEGPVRTAHGERLCPWPMSVRVFLIVVTMIGVVALRTSSLGLGREACGPFRPVPVLVIDPNSAPPEVLGALPQVGGALVKKIVEQREIRPFQSLDDLRRRVRGLGPATLARLQPHLRIGPSGQPSPTQDDRSSVDRRDPWSRETASRNGRISTCDESRREVRGLRWRLTVPPVVRSREARRLSRTVYSTSCTSNAL